MEIFQNGGPVMAVKGKKLLNQSRYLCFDSYKNNKLILENHFFMYLRSLIVNLLIVSKISRWWIKNGGLWGWPRRPSSSIFFSISTDFTKKAYIIKSQRIHQDFLKVFQRIFEYFFFVSNWVSFFWKIQKSSEKFWKIRIYFLIDSKRFFLARFFVKSILIQKKIEEGGLLGQPQRPAKGHIFEKSKNRPKNFEKIRMYSLTDSKPFFYISIFRKVNTYREKIEDGGLLG